MRELTNFTLASSGFEDFPMSSDIFESNYRSPGKSFLYSVAVPGTGQLYAGSKAKAIIFMGVEALAWAGFYIYHKDGVDKQDANRAYADKYWDPELYYDYLVEVKGITDDTQEFPGTNHESFTHHLPDTKTQQYYEMIGKYDQFQYGWIDTDYRRGDHTSAYRDQYLLDRNHLVSAFDAALTARKYNREQDTFSEYKVSPTFMAYEGHSLPTLTFSYKF